MQKYTVEINDYGNIFWYKFGTRILHREDGPALEWANGTKFWYKEDKIHREDGPAREWADGNKEYWLNGKRYTEADYLKLTAKTGLCEGKVVEIEGKKYKLVGIDKL